MGAALQHPVHGYYTRNDHQIGPEGDFTTAPEISQLFGEAIAIWCVAVWMSMGSPSKFNLVEMGPGKGTLMKDIIRTAQKFPDFRKAATVHLVETSAALRQKQREVLCCKLLEGSPVQTHANTSHNEEMKMRLPDNGFICWHSHFHTVPSGPLIFVGQVTYHSLSFYSSLLMR